ncbi:MAG: hypothetical protein COT88_00185 [Candidatus Colwellbacteria bacterium CG10_big_fil_rev_8_21_14_0_10_41_28]|uniref:DUF4145 domain-containing protein n=1 Tax=Candidatus Colwellbacteria bacterium CG10_big_fil_rev_8_21_14_0_10_41_28 TaxID=1974539 RepID=A0A2H0VHW9_9BACT|nr:MAG: hypothetical protein COT88_00185 [Candidatus Colwellbacteria bacterium CG10_big_fil_rev_8_21_14_0_10_41_28]
MDRLKKQIHNPKERKLDNLDKKELFDKSSHPKSANEYKDEWSFIKKKSARENIAYQMQYLEFLVNLYNEYQIYLTVESLHCKTMMIVIAGVVEGALSSIIGEGYKNVSLGLNQDKNFQSLIDLAYTNGLIGYGMKRKLNGLRRMRNSIHISSIDYQEHVAYEPDDVNRYLDLLDEFRDSLRKALI